MLEQLNRKFISHSAKRLNMSKLEFSSKILTDWWIYGTEILDYNVADSIVTVGCSKELYNLIYKKERKELSPLEVLLGVERNIELNGCPLLH